MRLAYRPGRVIDSNALVLKGESGVCPNCHLGSSFERRSSIAVWPRISSQCVAQPLGDSYVMVIITCRPLAPTTSCGWSGSRSVLGAGPHTRAQRVTFLNSHPESSILPDRRPWSVSSGGERVGDRGRLGPRECCTEPQRTW
jgi:hypothetical protein